jgi:hypothetical protein
VTSIRAKRRVFWAAVWLAIVLVAIKAYYLGVPATLAFTDFGNYFRSLAAISYVDVVFAAICWASARAILALTVYRRRIGSAVSIVFVGLRRLRRFTRWRASSSSESSAGFYIPVARARRQLRMLSSSVAATVTPASLSPWSQLPLIYATSSNNRAPRTAQR